MAEQPQETEARSRQEQILMLASEGLTDKEIAAKLRLSPETVGTYWRRILSKYAAASRTEVVAKVVRLQAEAEVGHLTQVSEGLREVADHLLVVLRDHRPESDEREAHLILEALPDLIVTVDMEGFTTYTNGAANAALELGEPFEWALVDTDRDAFRESLAAVLNGGESPSLDLQLLTGSEAVNFEVRISPISAGGAVLSLRQK